jgi:hypothetical protein
MLVDGLANTFDHIRFNEEDVENQISTYKLVFLHNRNRFIEWNVRLPMFVTSFYQYVLEKQAVPKQDEYWKFYLTDNTAYFSEASFLKEHMDGLQARVYRTYPSLVRDLHFGLMLKNSGIFKDVFFNEIMDIEYGIDLVVFIKGRPIGLKLYTDTRNALHAREVKNYRPKKTVNFKCIELPINFRGSKTCGMFFLYSDREIDLVNEAILSSV